MRHGTDIKKKRTNKKQHNKQIQVVDVGKLPDWPRRNCGHPFRANCLDDVVNMYESRVFLYSGSKDAHTPTAAVGNTINWYATMMSRPKEDLKYVIGDAGHHFPTANPNPDHLATPSAKPSATPSAPPLSGFDGAGACLTHVLNVSALQPPVTKVCVYVCE